MLDLRLFRRRRFAAATTTITVIFFAMYGTQFLLSQYLQLVLGYDPLQAGVRMLPIPLAFMAAAPLSARLVERNGQRRVVVLGLLLLAAGLVLLSRTGVHADYLYLAICLAVIASGMGLTTAPSTAAIMESLPLPKAGVGSAVNDTTRELGGALGVAVLGSLMASRFRSGLASGAQHVPVSQSLGDALARAATLPPSAGSTLARSARHAYVGASGFTLQVAAAGIGLTAVAVASLLRPDRLGTATSAVEAADAGCDRRVA
jgi:predicted MFS family arabinose efflux permease